MKQNPRLRKDHFSESLLDSKPLDDVGHVALIVGSDIGEKRGGGISHSHVGAGGKMEI